MYRRDFLLRSTTAAAAFGVFRRVPGGGFSVTSYYKEDDAPFVALRDRYFLRHLALNPVTSTYLGGDGYDASLRDVNGRLRDYSPKALGDEIRFYREIKAALGKIDPAELSVQARVDYHVMGAQLDFMLRETADRRYYQRAIDTYVAEPFRGVDWQMQQMTPGAGERLGTEAEWALVVTRVAAIPAYLAVARENIRAGKQAGNVPDKRMVERDGIGGSNDNATYFRTTLRDSARMYIGDRAFAEKMLGQLTTTGAKAAEAWEAFAKFLGETFDIHETADHYACGEEEYAWRVRHVLQDPRTTAQLYEYGAEQVKLYTDRMVDVAKEIAKSAGMTLPFGNDAERVASVRKVMEYLSNDAPKSDDELFKLYRDAGVRAVAYGRAQQLFDIPADYKLDVVPTPPVLRSTIDAAYYPAPPFKKSGVGRFYLTPTGNDPAALKAQSRATVADTAVHEGFPGHDWNYKYMSEHASEISNIRWLTPGAVEDSSSMWSDSMASEGWGLYAEELMAEPVPGRPYGFYDPGEYMYELQGQLLRAVRIRVDVGLHTGRMSFDDAIDYFTAHVDFLPGARTAAATDPASRASAEGAYRSIYRYSKWPTQAITYNLGKNAIVALREQVRKEEGAKFSERAFHERLMRMGTIPASYFREAFK